jgi:aspartyl-tRNA synthetase
VRTHYCTDVTENNIGETVTVAGWVNSRRDHGGLIFIDLRDKSGIVQLVCDPADNKNAWEIADKVRDEFVLIATGTVQSKR